MISEKRNRNDNPKFLGMKFGRLTVIGFREVENGKFHAVGWDCKCDCGNIVYGKKPYAVRSGKVRSCGCLKKEQDYHNLGEKRKTHGQSGTRLYGIWEKMRGRCNIESNPAYHNYGGRGIKVCDDWNTDFEKFYKWSMENGYTDELSIERIDVNEGYNPNNCCWIPLSDQNKNKRNCRYVMVDGEKVTLKEACRKLGLPYQAVHLRVTRYGMPIEEAISKPFQDRKNTLKKRCEGHAISYQAVVYRMKKLGWSEERALTTPVGSHITLFECEKNEKR